MNTRMANANWKTKRVVIEDLPVEGNELSDEHLQLVSGSALAVSGATSSTGPVIHMKSYNPASCTAPPIPGFASDTDYVLVD
jgi:hypothetical protein